MDPELAAQNQTIAGHIRDYGWHCLHVWPNADVQDAFAYSIGFAESFGAPEVLVFGLPRDKAHAVLGVCADLLRAGHVIQTGVVVSEVLSGDYCVVFRSLRDEWRGEYLGTAERYYGERSFGAVVMFFPDREHRFPWQDGYAGPPEDEALAITTVDPVSPSARPGPTLK